MMGNHRVGMMGHLRKGLWGTHNIHTRFSIQEGETRGKNIEIVGPG